LDAGDPVGLGLLNGFRISLFADALGLGPVALGADASGFGGIDEAGVGHLAFLGLSVSWRRDFSGADGHPF